MRVCRNDRVRRKETFRLRENHGLQFAHANLERLARLDGPQPRCRRNLVIAASASMQLARDVAHLFVQQAIDQRMHIFVARLCCFTCIEARRHCIESNFDGPALLESQHARIPQRHRPRLRQLYIVRPKPDVHANRAIQGF